jgi:hypothetical protein
MFVKIKINIFSASNTLPFLTIAATALNHPSAQLIDTPKPSPTSTQGNWQRSELAGAVQSLESRYGNSEHIRGALETDEGRFNFEQLVLSSFIHL